MQANITYLDGAAFEAEVRGHRVLCDQPAGAGDDRGMSPPEFLLVSLGTCAGYYALQYLKTRGLPTDGLRVTVEADKAMGPARLASFRVDVQVPELEERHKEGVLRAVHSCLIHHTLQHPPKVEIALQTAAAAQR